VYPATSNLENQTMGFRTAPVAYALGIAICVLSSFLVDVRGEESSGQLAQDNTGSQLVNDSKGLFADNMKSKRGNVDGLGSNVKNNYTADVLSIDADTDTVAGIAPPMPAVVPEKTHFHYNSSNFLVTEMSKFIQKYFGNVTRDTPNHQNKTGEAEEPKPVVPPSVDIHTQALLNPSIKITLPDVPIIPTDNKPHFVGSKTPIQPQYLGAMAIPQHRRNTKYRKLHVRPSVDVRKNNPKAS